MVIKEMYFQKIWEKKILRSDCKICLFNNSYVWKDVSEHMSQIKR